jgi:hypothetical protein
VFAPFRQRRLAASALAQERRESAVLNPVVRLSIQSAVQDLDRRFPPVRLQPTIDPGSALIESGDATPVAAAEEVLLIPE